MRYTFSPTILGLCALSLLQLGFSSDASVDVAPCGSNLYCQGDILKAVQLSGIFEDDKTFVDKPTLVPEADVIAAFAKLGKNPSKSDIKAFVTANFGDETSLLRPANLNDWVPNPKFLGNINDPYLKGFASAINEIWKNLIREQDLSGLCEGCTSSFLKINGTFVVPGGRFREFYYWDTYFSMEGMLLSELYDTVKGMIEIFFDYVNQYGFIPNGTRQYYLNRSQPPLLTQMVNIYYNATKDNAFLVKAIPILKKEHAYWVHNHSVNFTIPEKCGNRFYTMYRYDVKNTLPRPEGYSVDYKLVNSEAIDVDVQKKMYAELSSAAESGFDFSSRWATNPNLTSPDILKTLAVTDILPSDLNAIMYENEKLIAEFSKIASTLAKTEDEKNAFLTDNYIYEKLSRRTYRGMMKFLFDKNTGMFNDYSISNKKSTVVWSVSNVWAYWYLGDFIDADIANKAWDYVSTVAAKNPGGLPVTNIDSGLQWDFPDAWPPLQYTTIKGLLTSASSVEKSNPERSKKYHDTALKLANSLVGSSYCGWYLTGGSIPGLLDKLPNVTDNGHLFEKLNSTNFGFPAGGGEYTVQPGFGWTNGVVLWLLNMYGDKLTVPNCSA
ncbi:Trehalase [Smittium culicis]|uniref:Trehalase n=1 Tax=Smittium culicis TaxID=133412 RepID=A0A1R1YA46_9FUNG|nr:Trehalase [Smittium culicis]